MVRCRGLGAVRSLVFVLAIAYLVFWAAFPQGWAQPGTTAGDCWKVNPQTGMPVAVNMVASPQNPIDCALPANTCETKNNCEPYGNGWVRWVDTIRMGDCSKPNKNGNCQICPERLTCAVGHTYATANDCNNQQNRLPIVVTREGRNNNCK